MIPVNSNHVTIFDRDLELSSFTHHPEFISHEIFVATQAAIRRLLSTQRGLNPTETYECYITKENIRLVSPNGQYHDIMVEDGGALSEDAAEVVDTANRIWQKHLQGCCKPPSPPPRLRSERTSPYQSREPRGGYGGEQRGWGHEHYESREPMSGDYRREEYSREHHQHMELHPHGRPPHEAGSERGRAEERTEESSRRDLGRGEHRRAQSEEREPLSSRSSRERDFPDTVRKVDLAAQRLLQRVIGYQGEVRGTIRTVLPGHLLSGHLIHTAEDHKVKLTGLNQEITDLIRDLRDQEVSSHLASTLGQLAVLQDAIRDQQDHLDTLLAKQAVAGEAAAEEAAEPLALHHARAALQDALTNLAGSQSQVRSLEGQVEGLRRGIYTLKDEKDDLEDKVQELEEDLNSSSEQIEKLEIQIKGLERALLFACQQAEGARTAFHEQIAALEKDNQLLSTQLQNALHKVDDGQKLITQKEEELANLLRASQGLRKTASNIAENLKKAEKKALQDSNAFGEQLREKDTEVTRLAGLLDEANGRITEIEQRQQAAHTEHQRALADADLSIEALRKKIDSLGIEKDTLTDNLRLTLEKLKAANDQLLQTAFNLEQSERQNALLQSQNSRLNEELGATQDNWERANTNANELQEELLNTIGELRSAEGKLQETQQELAAKITEDQAKQREISSLREELERLNSQKNTLARDVHAAQENLDAAKADAATKQAELQEALTLTGAQGAKIATLIEEFKNFRDSIGKNWDENAELDSDLEAELEADLAQKNLDMDDLRAQLRSAKKLLEEAQQEAEAASAQVNLLQQEDKSNKALLTDLTSRVNDLNALVQELTNALGAAQDEEKHLTKKLSALKKNLDEIQEEALQTEFDLKEQLHAMTMADTAKGFKIEDLLEAATVSDQEAREREKALAALQAELNTTKEQASALESALERKREAALEQSRDYTDQAQSFIKQSQVDIQKLANQLETSQQALANKTTEAAAKQKEIDGLRRELATLGSSNDELRAQRDADEIAFKEAKAHALAKETELQQAILENDQLCAGLEPLLADTAELRASIEEKEAENARVQTSLVQSNRRAEELTRQLQNDEQELEKLRGKAEANIAEIAKLEERQRDNAERIEELEDANLQLSSTLGEKERSIEDLNRELKELEAKIGPLANQLKEMEQSLNLARTEIHAKELELEEALRANTAQAQNILDLNVKLEQNTQLAKERETELEHLRTQQEELQRQLASLQQQLRQNAIEIARANRSAQESEQEAEKLRSELTGKELGLENLQAKLDDALALSVSALEEADGLKRKQDELNITLGALTKKKGELEKQVEDTERDHKKALADSEAQQAELLKSFKSQDKVIEQLGNQLRLANLALAEKEAAHIRLLGTLNAERAASKALRRQLVIVGGRLDAARSQAATELDAARSQAATVRNELGAARSQAEQDKLTLTRMQQDQEDNLRTIDLLLDEKEKVLASQQKIEAQLTALEKELLEKPVQQKELDQVRAAAKTAEEKLRAELEALKNSSDATIAAQGQELLNLNTAAENARLRAEEQAAHLHTVEEGLAGSAKANGDLRMRIGQAEEEAATANRQAEGLKSDVTRLTNQLAAYTDTIEKYLNNLEGRLNAAKEALAQSQAALEEKEREAATAQASLADKTQRLAASESSIRDAIQVIIDARTAIRILEQQKLGLQFQSTSLEGRASTAERALSDANEKNRVLAKEFAEVQDKANRNATELKKQIELLKEKDQGQGQVLSSALQQVEITEAEVRRLQQEIEQQFAALESQKGMTRHHAITIEQQRREISTAKEDQRNTREALVQAEGSAEKARGGLQGQIDQLQQEHRSALAEKVQKALTLQVQLSTLAQENLEHQREIGRISGEKQDAQRQLSDATSKSGRISTELIRVQAEAEESNRSLSAKLSRLGEKNAGQAEELREALARAAEADRKLLKVTRDSLGERERVNRLEAEFNLKTGHLIGQIKEREDRIKNLLKQQTQALQTQRSAEHQLQLKEQALQGAMAELATVRSEYDKLLIKCQPLRETIKKASKTNEALEEQLGEFRRETERLHKLETERRKRKSKPAEEVEPKPAMNVEDGELELRQRLEAAQALLQILQQENAPLLTKINELENQLGPLQRNVDLANAAREEAERVAREASQEVHDIERLNIDLGADVYDLTERLATSEETLLQGGEAALARFTELSTAAEEATEAKQRLEQQVTVMQAQLDAANANLAQPFNREQFEAGLRLERDRVVQVEAQKDEVEKRLEDLGTKHDAVEEKNRSLQQLIDNLQATKIALDGKLLNLIGRLSQLEEGGKLLPQDKEAKAKSEQEILEHEEENRRILTELRQKQASLEGEIATLKRHGNINAQKLSESERREHQLRREIQDLMLRLNQLENNRGAVIGQLKGAVENRSQLAQQEETNKSVRELMRMQHPPTTQSSGFLTARSKFEVSIEPAQPSPRPPGGSRVVTGGETPRGKVSATVAAAPLHQRRGSAHQTPSSPPTTRRTKQPQPGVEPFMPPTPSGATSHHHRKKSNEPPGAIGE